MGEGATKIKQVQTRERGMGGEGGPNFGTFCQNLITECRGERKIQQRS